MARRRNNTRLSEVDRECQAESAKFQAELDDFGKKLSNIQAHDTTPDEINNALTVPRQGLQDLADSQRESLRQLRQRLPPGLRDRLTECLRSLNRKLEVFLDYLKLTKYFKYIVIGLALGVAMSAIAAILSFTWPVVIGAGVASAGGFALGVTASEYNHAGQQAE